MATCPRGELGRSNFTISRFARSRHSFLSAYFQVTLQYLLPPGKTSDGIFYFYLPYNRNIATRRGLPRHRLRIAFRNQKNINGTLSLGGQLEAQEPKPTSIRLYSDKSLALSCSFGQSENRYLLNEDSITHGTLKLLDYAKWVLLDEIDEGRIPSLSTEINSNLIKSQVSSHIFPRSEPKSDADTTWCAASISEVSLRTRQGHRNDERRHES